MYVRPGQDLANDRIPVAHAVTPSTKLAQGSPGGLGGEIPNRTPRRGIFPRPQIRPSDTFRGYEAEPTSSRIKVVISRWNLARRMRKRVIVACARCLSSGDREQVSGMFRVTVTRERMVSDGRVIQILRLHILETSASI